MATVCQQCKNLYRVNASDSWLRWLCYAYPLPQKMNYVVGDLVADPPYSLCRHINTDGNCAAFEAGANQLHPKEAADVQA